MNDELKRSISTKSLKTYIRLKRNSLSQQIDQLNDDLEWDKHRDFTLKTESETMSHYDINEQMNELKKFLEFEMMTGSSKSLASCSNIKTLENNNSLLATPSDGLTLEDLIQIKFVHNNNRLFKSNSFYNSDKMLELESLNLNSLTYAPITFDYETCLQKCKYSSMPNLNEAPKEELKSFCKHSSLANLNFLYQKRKISLCGSSAHFSQMSNLAKIISYWTRISDSVRQLVNKYISSDSTRPFYTRLIPSSKQQHQNKELFTINEETIETYDIIEVHDILETPNDLIKVNK